MPVDIFKDKKILVTGGTGTIGSAIVKRILTYHNPAVVRILSNDENSLFEMMQTFGDQDQIRYLVGDVRDEKRMVKAADEIDTIFHCAAMKHVPFCEYNPFDAVQTNVIGTNNVINAALVNNVEKMITISTDKAVNPISTMGATKLLAEKLTIDANFYYKGSKRTIFSCVRFGNVLFSRGSVVPLFESQIKSNHSLTVTDVNMTRFMMKTSDAISLIFKTISISKGGEIFILKMPVVRLEDLIDVLTLGRRVRREIVGVRPGEKMHEELMTGMESLNAFETDDMLIILPTTPIKVGHKYKLSDYPRAKYCSMKSYSSADSKPLTIPGIRRLLQ